MPRVVAGYAGPVLAFFGFLMFGFGLLVLKFNKK
jgi:hypothetical protein